MRSPRDILSDPHLMRRISGFLIPLSAIEWVTATVFGWVNDVAYVSHLSQLAITLSLIPWWQGLRLEEKQAEEDIPREVVERVVEQTNIQAER